VLAAQFNGRRRDSWENALKERSFSYHAIGVVHSPHSDPHHTPIQPVYAAGIKGRVDVFAEYEVGLQDLEGFSHIYLVYAFDRADAARLIVTPFLQDRKHGVFATRAPCRPNALGLSVVRLVARKGRVLEIEDVDILDGTPLLDIKPYVSRFDSRVGSRSGWLEDIDDDTAWARSRGCRDGGSCR
jgi:tRNA-Thr(GGU) m(6)t(6)A37 methyltransferase TsaA